MDALLLTNYMEMALTEMPVPSFAPDEVLVRVKACGICGSDVHGFDGSTGRRIPPIVMGHEAAGVVVEVGANVKGLQKGDRVTFDSTVYCGACFFCRRGDVNLCDNRQVLGVSCGEFRRHGAFAEFVNVPERIVYKLPDAVPFEHAAMIEAVSIAVHAVAITPIKLADTAVVVGSGMIGLLVIQALRNAGCGRIIAVDVDDAKLKMAKTAGRDRYVQYTAMRCARGGARTHGRSRRGHRYGSCRRYGSDSNRDRECSQRRRCYVWLAMCRPKSRSRCKPL